MSSTSFSYADSPFPPFSVPFLPPHIYRPPLQHLFPTFALTLASLSHAVELSALSLVPLCPFDP